MERSGPRVLTRPLALPLPPPTLRQLRHSCIARLAHLTPSQAPVPRPAPPHTSVLPCRPSTSIRCAHQCGRQGHRSAHHRSGCGLPGRRKEHPVRAAWGWGGTWDEGGTQDEGAEGEPPSEQCSLPSQR